MKIEFFSFIEIRLNGKLKLKKAKEMIKMGNTFVEVFDEEKIEEIRKRGSELCQCWKTRDKTCNLGRAKMYEHDGGVYIKGKKERQWLYFTCSRCGYQWAWHKIKAKMMRDENDKTG
jgi:hypothetical protein